jgi:CHASE2 domain-containing sensor protein
MAIPLRFRWHAGLLLAAGACAVLGFVATRIASQTSWSLYEQHFPTAPAAASRVVIAEIDAESLARYGPWKFDRALHAKAAQRAFDAGALVVGVDLMFPDRLHAAGDADLASLARSNKDLVLAYQAIGGEPGGRFFPELSLAGPTAGFIDVVPPERQQLAAMVPMRAGETSMALAVAQRYCLRTRDCVPRVRSSATDMAFGRVPMEVWGINVHVPAAAIPRVAFHRLLEGEATALRGKIVFISPADPSLEDMHWIPQGAQRAWLPGTVALAYAVETAIDGSAIVAPSMDALAALLLLANWGVLAMALRAGRWHHGWLAAYALVLLAMHFTLMRAFHVHLPVLLIAFNAAGLWLVVAVLTPAKHEGRSPPSPAHPFEPDDRLAPPKPRRAGPPTR